MQRQPFPVRLQAGHGPISHRSPRHRPPRATIFTRIGGANRLGAGKLRRPPGSDPKRLADSLIIRRIPMKPLKRDQKSIRLPDTSRTSSLQRRTRGLFKPGAPGSIERGA
jgi:hypothetical protein